MGQTEADSQRYADSRFERKRRRRKRGKRRRRKKARLNIQRADLAK